MAKIHLVAGESPISNRVDTTPLCGQNVSKAEIVFMWDEQVMGGEIEIPVISTCRKCIESMMCSGFQESRYVYGVTEGEK